MRILGLGFPEMLFSLTYLIIPAVFLALLYFVIKSAVKKGTIEAQAEIKKGEVARQPLPPMQDQQ